MILRVSNNIHQIPLLESVELVEEWVEEEKIPVKKDAAPKKDVNTPDKPAEESKPDVNMKPEDVPKQEFEIKKR